MIALDEERVGRDQNCIILQGLRVCLGIVCVLTDGTLVGVHLTPHTDLLDLQAMVTQLAILAKVGVDEVYIVGHIPAWKHRNDEFDKHMMVQTIRNALPLSYGATIRRATKTSFVNCPANGALDVRFTVGNNNQLVIDARLTNAQQATAQGSGTDTWWVDPNTHVMKPAQNTPQSRFHTVPVVTNNFQAVQNNVWKVK